MQKWCTGWWKAEGEEALRQLDDILNAESAWQPAPALWGSAPSDGVHEASAADNDDYEPRHAPLESPADHLGAPMSSSQRSCAEPPAPTPAACCSNRRPGAERQHRGQAQPRLRMQLSS